MVETSGTVVHLKQPFNATRINAFGIDFRVKQLQVRTLILQTIFSNWIYSLNNILFRINS